MVKIEGREVTTKDGYLDKVTYVPRHAEGNAGHEDCEQGVIIRVGISLVHVLYCKGRTVQCTDPEYLVWG